MNQNSNDNCGCQNNAMGNFRQNQNTRMQGTPPGGNPQLPPLSFEIPPQSSFDSEEMRGSIQQILAQNIGEYVVIEFLIGTERLMRKQGLLYYIGRNYVTLYDDVNNNFILCDIFSVKFIYFYYPGQRPNRKFNILPAVDGNRN